MISEFSSENRVRGLVFDETLLPTSLSEGKTTEINLF